MELTIDENTKTEEIVYLLDSSNVDELLKQIDALPLSKDITDFTIEEFDALLNNTAPYVARLAKENTKALVFLGKYKTLKNSIDGFFKFVEQYKTKQSSEEKQAAKGINFPSFGDCMLGLMIKYYGLHSIDDAKIRTVAEYLFALQDTASSALFEWKLNEIYRKKSKQKK